MILKKYKLLDLSCVVILTLVILFSIKNNQNRLESVFKQTLSDIQQNSIKNFEWKELDWQNYHDNQIKRLPIFTKKYFYTCIENALKDLHDNHSVLIKKHNVVTTTSNIPVKKLSIKVEKGIGIINFPALITEVDRQDAILSEALVTECNNKIESIASHVTGGWIIDLTQNSGGNMFPMLAALSYFYNEPNLGGFYSRIKNKTEKALLFFDGQSFTFDTQDFNLSYKTKFKTNQNRLPVVVLIGKNTASSGEFLALALKRQHQVILAGQESGGSATGNEVMQLSHDLGSYALTVAYFLDANNQPFLEEKINPTFKLKDNENIMSQAKQLIGDIN